LAILLMKPKSVLRDELDRMVRSVGFVQVADWLNAYVVKKHPEKEALRQTWMAADDRWAARAGWSLTAERIAKSPDGLDLPALLDRVEAEMPSAAPEVQWTIIRSRRAARRRSRRSGSTRWSAAGNEAGPHCGRC
jgi:3-methyladenine DNA glycosylase AlkD